MTALAPAQSHDSHLYLEVTHFYGRQMRAMDSGDARAWADSFVADGIFEANAHPHPVVGREQIEASALAAHQQLLDQGLRRRHWLGMLQIDDDDADGTVRVQSYAQVLQTAIGGTTELRLSTTCVDILTRVDGRLKVVRRSVSRDDLA